MCAASAKSLVPCPHPQLVDGRISSRTNDPAAQAIRGTIQSVQEFFEQTFGHRGADGRGRHDSVVVDWNCENGAWSCQLGECAWLFNDRYAFNQAVIGHEWTCAVLDHFGLGHSKQAGALRESISDVFGITFRVWAGGEDDHWQVLNGDLSQHIDMGSFCSLQPWQVPDEANDYGHVHHNSLIPSHAYCMAVQIVEKMKGDVNSLIKIWFSAASQVTPQETFEGFARKTLQQAHDLIALNALTCAWSDVGVLPIVIPAEHVVRDQTENAHGRELAN